MAWWESALRLLLAVAVGWIIGAEREHKHRPAGMRTHVLVCLGAALVTVMEGLNAQSVLALQGQSGVSVSLGRMSAQVISGIGFLGAGTIFVAQKKIAGLTTAASLWCTACLGLAAGMGHYLLAGAGALVVLLTLSVMRRLVKGHDTRQMEVSFTNRVETLSHINSFLNERGVRVVDVDFHVDSSGPDKICTSIYTLALPPRLNYTDLVMQLSEHDTVLSIRTRNL